MASPGTLHSNRFEGAATQSVQTETGTMEVATLETTAFEKGRDLFDLALALEHADFDPGLLVEAFEQYMSFGGTPLTRAQLEANMAAKITDRPFLEDVPALLRTGLTYDPAEVWRRVHAAIVTRLPGEPWKGDADSG